MTRQQRLATLPAALLVAVALASLVLGQVVPGVVLVVLAVVGAVAGQVVVRRSARLLPLFLVVGVALVARAGIAVAEGYVSERLSKCHDPSGDDRRRVRAVADNSVGDLVAVRHNGTSYIAGVVGGDKDVAVFGVRRSRLRAVNEAARDHSSAGFDHLFGLGGVLVIDGPSKDGKQEGRLKAIERVGACALSE